MNRPPPFGFPPRGLYVLTPEPAPPIEELESNVAAAIAGGAVVVQYRDKHGGRKTRVQNARALLAVCHAHGVPLIVNDDVDLAVEIEADGVHIGKDDASLDVVKRVLGSQVIVGVSCYNSAARAIVAAQEGADYVALGSFFSSKTKPKAIRCSKTVLVEVAAQVSTPVVAIGGITPDNAAELVSSGADLLAVLTGVFSATDVYESAQKFAELF